MRVGGRASGCGDSPSGWSIGRRSLAVARHVNWALADQAVVSGSNFLTGILVARHLGVEEFGRFSLAWMVVLFVGGLQTSLLTAPMMSISPKQTAKDRNAYVGSVLTLQLAFGLLSVLAVLLATPVVGAMVPDWDAMDIAGPLALLLLLVQLQDFQRRCFFTEGRPALALASDVIRYALQIVLLLALFRTGAVQDGEVQGGAASGVTVLWVAAATSGLAILAGLRFTVRPVLSATAVRRTAHRHWRFSRWLFASSLLSWSSTNLFTVAVGVLVGPAALGALRAAQNLTGLTSVLMQGLQNVIPIRAAVHFAAGGTNALATYVRLSALLVGAATTVVMAVAAAAPEFWMRAAYGDAFAAHSGLLVWCAVIAIVSSLELPISAGLRAMERTRPTFNAYVVGTLFTLVTLYPLQRFFGLDGMMAGLLGTWLVQTAVMALGYGGESRTVAATVPRGSP